ncbi:MAG: hypothetical protein JSR67_12010 [Proteobacteria bacterium]|nr:hypothetical protein [Pseudomonadota bacterium]
MAAWLVSAPQALAVPSFARQTGMACEACHTVFPELTHFGRVFKANGYTLSNVKQVQDVTGKKEELLSLAQMVPLSIMAQVSYSQMKTGVPDLAAAGAPGVSQNGTAGFPQQLSLFYAGKIAPNFGAFFQITYASDSGTIGIDNTDLRFAGTTLLSDNRPLTYGLSLNNNPTVQDLWNTTPSWGYPFTASNAVVSPLAGTAIDGAFAQDVSRVISTGTNRCTRNSAPIARPSRARPMSSPVAQARSMDQFRTSCRGSRPIGGWRTSTTGAGIPLRLACTAPSSGSFRAVLRAPRFP